MKQIVTKFHKPMAVMAIVFSLSVLISLGSLAGVFNIIEYKLYDFRVNLFAGASRPSDDIIIILLDQVSIDWAQQDRGRRWGWPWPREASHALKKEP